MSYDLVPNQFQHKQVFRANRVRVIGSSKYYVFLLQSDKWKTLLLVLHIAFTGAFALVLVLVVALN